MFRLELLAPIRIYLVFHISLLELASENARRGLVYIDEEIQELLYEVDYIIGYKLVQDKHYYLIYWKEYQYSEDTWESEEYLTPDLVQGYH